MTKPAYMIISIDLHDPSGMGAYQEGTMPILAQCGAEVLAATDKFVVEDGSWSRQRVAIIKFPSMDAAKSFWASPDYQPMKTLRESFSDQDNILVEGVQDEEPGSGAAGEDTPHYMLGSNTMKNADWVQEYMEKVPPISAKFGLEALAAGPDFEVLDGKWPGESMVLLKFPSEQAYRDFWFGEEYRAMKELREANTVGDHISFSGGMG